MKTYTSKYDKISGSSFSDDITAVARREYHSIQKRTPRRHAYIRSKYFKGDKIFIDLFWEHLNQKHPVERIKRLKFYKCALDLLRNSKFDPDTIYSHSQPGQALHRFSGKTKDGELFYVQVKQNKRSDRKDFMSVFPANNKR